ncbi:hypothetical protein QFC20_003303 [Naganishia adeliensis]|uniref:Uncharacterized protein n=1 Tax=Naganishia adeliensis TaxID=92952 RepID=A0ACC2WEQ9_9TREE|nr:hypothetical protein QFC20_003303 [Naganishia adeliensis]
MERVNARLAVEVAKESRRKGVGYDEYKKELKRQLADAQSALVKKHKCHPLATALAPPLIHLPIFLLLSLTIRQAAALATPPPIDLSSSLDEAVPTSAYAAFANEHVGWLTSLVEPDPGLVIPFGIGLMAFANVEVMQSWRKDVSSSATNTTKTPTTTPTKPGSPSSSGKIKPNFGRISPTAKRTTSIIQHEHAPGNMSPGEARKRDVDLQAGTMRQRVVGNVMRILAVVTVGIAAEVPAAVAIYWFTSTGYTLVQNIALGYLDRRNGAKSVADN